MPPNIRTIPNFILPLTGTSWKRNTRMTSTNLDTSLRKNNLLIISYCNYFYREIALNWVKALERLGIDNYLIFSIDEACDNFLREKGINSRFHPIPDLPEKQARGGMTRKMGLERFKIIRSLVAAGTDVIYSDLDAVWIKDPRDSLCCFSDFHIVASAVRHTHAWPPHVAKEWKFTLCTGWLGFKGAPTTASFLDELLNFFLNSRRPAPGKLIVCDQDAFNSYLLHAGFTPFPEEGHQAVLKSGSGDFNLLALHPDLVHRGGGRPSSLVVHPVSPKTAEKTKGKLKSKKLWFLNE